MFQFFLVPGGGPLAAGTLSAFPGTTTTLLSEATVSGGQPPYSTQFYRAPDVAGSPGVYATTGTPVGGAVPSRADTGLTPGTKYWWKAVTTDNASTQVTSNQVSATTLTSTFVVYSVTMEPAGFITG